MKMLFLYPNSYENVGILIGLAYLAFDCESRRP